MIDGQTCICQGRGSGSGSGSGSAYCQTQSPQYPTRQISMIAAGPGGSVDLVARVLAQGLAGVLQQPVTVENRPAGVVPNQLVARAQPDGYTLLYSGASLWLTP